MAHRIVEYLGGPLDGEREAIELARDPSGDRWALCDPVTVPVGPRPDRVHVYSPSVCGTRYRYRGHAPAA